VQSETTENRVCLSGVLVTHSVWCVAKCRTVLFQNRVCLSGVLVTHSVLCRQVLSNNVVSALLTPLAET
jgi:hypothetical protein